MTAYRHHAKHGRRTSCPDPCVPTLSGWQVQPHPTRALARVGVWVGLHTSPKAHLRHAKAWVAASRSGGRVRDTTRTRLSRPLGPGPVPLYSTRYLFLAGSQRGPWPGTKVRKRRHRDVTRMIREALAHARAVLGAGNVLIRKVRGHSGHAGNDIADELATEGRAGRALPSASLCLKAKAAFRT